MGVNAVAREARVDKVLIYRYFGGLPNLLESFADRADFWPTAQEIVGAPEDATSRWTAADWGVASLRGLLRELRARPTTQEVLRWELAASNELTERLADVRERRGLDLLRRVPLDSGPPPPEDVSAVAALLSAGIIYLVLRSKTAPVWLGVSLDTEEGWERIERAIESIVRGVLRRSGPGRREP